MQSIQISVKTITSNRSVVNDEKCCVVDVDEAPGLDQACTRGKRGQERVGGGGGVMTASLIIMPGLHNTFIRLTFGV